MEERLHLYEKLLSLPLFMGMGSEEMSEIIGQTRFGFFKVPAGETAIHEGDACTRLVILLHGSVAAMHQADDHGYTVIEQLSAPVLIEPFQLFGLHPHYVRTYNAIADSGFVTLGKDEVMALFDRYLVFRLNWLNLLTTTSQKLAHGPWRVPLSTLRQRIARFVVDHCLRPAGRKEIHIRMLRLADELHESRLHVSQALHSLQADGLLTLSRSRITIPALEDLIARS